MNCNGTNTSGEPCEAPDNMLDASGYCPTHRPGGLERLHAAAAKGGAATAQKHQGKPFDPSELQPMTNIEDAKGRLVQILDAVLTRRITHSEGASAAKAVAEWVKAENSAVTQRLVNELRTELEAKTEEIADLRRQLSGRRGLKVG